MTYQLHKYFSSNNQKDMLYALSHSVSQNTEDKSSIVNKICNYWLIKTFFSGCVEEHNDC